MSTQTTNRGEQAKETGRIEAFSDGVFAIAITLLILDIKVPPVQAWATVRCSMPSSISGLHTWPLPPVSLRS